MSGIIPSLNVAAGLLGFVGLKALTTLLSRLNWGGLPFTQQENTVIQTSVVAGYSLAFSGATSMQLTACALCTNALISPHHAETMCQ